LKRRARRPPRLPPLSVMCCGQLGRIRASGADSCGSFGPSPRRPWSLSRQSDDAVARRGPLRRSMAPKAHARCRHLHDPAQPPTRSDENAGRQQRHPFPQSVVLSGEGDLYHHPSSDPVPVPPLHLLTQSNSVQKKIAVCLVSAEFLREAVRSWKQALERLGQECTPSVGSARASSHGTSPKRCRAPSQGCSLPNLEVSPERVGDVPLAFLPVRGSSQVGGPDRASKYRSAGPGRSARNKA
jgi:hypothetical protein